MPFVALPNPWVNFPLVGPLIDAIQASLLNGSPLTLTISGTGKTALTFTDTTTTTGLTIGDDTNLYRSAANLLKTDDELEIGFAGGKDALRLTSTAADTGLTIGGDTNLYRAAADTLKTDDKFQASSIIEANLSNTANLVSVGYVNGAANPGISFGAAADVSLYRFAADILKTDDKLIVGTSDPVSGAQLSAVKGGDCIEFGHTNTAGYRSTIGADNGGGRPRIVFYGEHGSTGSETVRTRGFRASIIEPDNSGGFYFGNVANANADSQTRTIRAQIINDGRVLSAGLDCHRHPYGNLRHIESGSGAYNSGGGNLGTVSVTFTDAYSASPNMAGMNETGSAPVYSTALSTTGATLNVFVGSGVAATLHWIAEGPD